MISLHNIFSIAKYERKTLFRSWFFRIFTILSLLVLFGMNFGLVIESGGGEGWAIRAVPSAIPYFNLLILNVAQAVIAVFLASDFLKRDKKLDTTEVIYMRPVTNGEYVAGKTLGNIIVFLLLNILVVIMALVFNLLAKGTAVDWLAYGAYILLISIPTLVFIMGLSFLLMSVIRNQAITFVLILGYIGITLFLLKAKYYYIFDYMAFNIPMLRSDIAGFGNFDVILIHRGIYFGLGLGFIFLTTFLLKRLPQSSSSRYISLVLGFVLVGGAGYLAYDHVHSFRKAEDIRTEAIELNNQYANEAVPMVTANNLKVQHKGQAIDVKSTLTVKNEHKTSLNELIFSLNPGFKIQEIKINGQDVTFLRKKHLVIISDNVKLNAGDSAKVEFGYSGTVDENYCYLDVDEETRLENYGKFILNVDKRYSFITTEYVLLTSEDNWYPKTGVTYNTKSISWSSPSFAKFNLDVKTSEDLQVISQGKMQEITAGEFKFTPQTPLTQISLAIGQYSCKSVIHDNLKFNVWYINGHNYFSDVFKETKDTLAAVAAETFNDFKRNYNLDYNLSSMSLVEVPAQFKTYERNWTSVLETVQPGQVFVQEKGCMMRSADFIKQKERMGKRRGGPGGGRGRSDMTEKDKEINVFSEFLRQFTDETDTKPNFQRGGEMSVNESQNPYFVFPWLYNFQNNIQSSHWPIINRVFEAYLKNQTTDMHSLFMSNMSGESSELSANIALQDYSFKEILADPDQKDVVDDVIKMKGDVLFSTIQNEAGQEKFENFIHKLLSENKYKNISFEDFDKKINNNFGFELKPIMDNWYNAKALPGYLISPIKGVKVKSGNSMKTMVSLKVTNFSDIDGLVKLTFRISSGSGGRGGFGPPGMGNEETIDKLIKLNAGQTKELSYLFTASPRMVILNTMTSQNIPQTFMQFFREIDEDEKATPWEGERICETPVQTKLPNEQIVDNEDPEFEITQNDNVSLLEKLIIKEEEKTDKYSGLNMWNPPSKWTAITNSDYYGDYVRSAYYIKGGDGSQVAKWNVPLKKAGYYDVYFYYYKMRGFGPGRRNRKEKGNYDFIIHNDDGDEEITFDVKNAENGWNHLGSYYFSSDKAVIELTNKTELKTVLADAVKIVEL